MRQDSTVIYFLAGEGRLDGRAENLPNSNFLQAVVTMDISVCIILLYLSKSIFVFLESLGIDEIMLSKISDTSPA